MLVAFACAMNGAATEGSAAAPYDSHLSVHLPLRVPSKFTRSNEHDLFLALQHDLVTNAESVAVVNRKDGICCRVGDRLIVHRIRVG